METDTLQTGGEPPNQRVVRVLSGNLDDLPSLSSKIVRIFTSSTFTDTTVERNALMESVYPKIKEYCREKHGLEFQVVDMRWGVRDEATDDHMTTELCMKEIENCQRLSVGPNFVVFLGQKYGYRPIPTIIPGRNFNMLLGVIGEVPSDKELLCQWYKEDTNAVPSVYILQPISSILSNFNNKRHQRLMEADQAQWWEIMGKLQRMLRKAAQVLLLARKLDREQMHNYFMSVTEREVHKGILDAKDTKEHTLAYIRNISSMNTQALRFARNFIDMAGRNIDLEAQKLLATLRDDKLTKKLNEESISRFTVEWSGKEGIDRETHLEYLNQFCQHFQSSILTLVDRAVVEDQKLSSDPVYREILQHLHACKNFCKIFQGREEVMERIKAYICGQSREPLILWGQSGCGKTSLLAKAYSQVPEWLGADKPPVMALRFLGTSPDSSTIIMMITSVCKQIATNYREPKDEIPDELSPLCQHFKKLLHCATVDKPLVLFLDSLDQLSAADGAHQLAWLPVALPDNVRLVVSTLPNYYGILDTLRRMVETEENYVQITPLGNNLSEVILKSWLRNAGRQVTAEQWKVVIDAINKCNLPLFVKLVFDEISQWRSVTKVSSNSLAFTIHESISKLYERIENQHGKILVSHALGYITASKSGVSEAELEDLLSLDEKVLNDVYQYHIPPVRRIPPLLWTRIRNDLPHYFSEREADGINVINWYHRQFIEVSHDRYFKNLNFKSEIHSHHADFFLGIWGGVPKPFEYTELQRQRFFLQERNGECDRKVPDQPECFRDENGKVTRFNLRKLSELPFHLIRSKRYEELYNNVLFNYNFLHAKLSCMPLQTVLADFEDALDHQFDKDVKLLADALRLSASILSHHPDMLGPQIVGRLLPYYHSHVEIKEIIKQCDTDGIRECALVPTYHCMHTPGGPLQYSLEGHPFAPFGVRITSDARYLVSVSNMFIIWDLTTGGVFRQIQPGVQGIMQNLWLSPDDKRAICYTNNNQVIICTITTGEFTVIEQPVNVNDNIIGTTLNNTHVAVWTLREWYIYNMDGSFVCKETVSKINNALLSVEFGTKMEANERYLIWKSGQDDDDDMILDVQNGNTDSFDFHSAIAISEDKRTLYACIAISDDAVAVYKKEESSWKYDRTLGDNMDKVFSLTLSPGEGYLTATVALGYKIWELKSEKMKYLKLPTGIRNIPTKHQMAAMIAFSRNNEFLVAGVRKNMYVWDTKAGNLVKTLDAHFGRIIAIQSSISHGTNQVVSASIDKTIKVWNFDNILEDVHTIDRHEKPIEALSLAANAYIGATTTRSCVGVWNLENGKLLKTLSSGSHNTKVSHSSISADAKYVVSAEAISVVFWDVEHAKALGSFPQTEVLQLLLTDDDAKVLAFSKCGPNKGKCICRSVPAGEKLYEFEFQFKTFRSAVVTCDGLFLIVPAVTAKKADILSVYHAKTGTHMYDMTPKYPNYKDYDFIIAMPNESTHVALIDNEKGNIWDVKKKNFVRSINKWNGECTQNGKFGLYAPNRGGLELLDLKTGRVVKTLIPKIAEGVFNVTVLFTKNDQNVIYYHSGHRSIRVFRVSDGKKIADFKAHAEIRALASTQGGASIVLGAVDGSVVTLTIADPAIESNKEFISMLPSRQVALVSNGTPHSKAANGMSNGPAQLGAAIQVARFVAKAKNAQKSRACVIQ